jgi:transcriptional regulator with XRE-family HTH domain
MNNPLWALLVAYMDHPARGTHSMTQADLARETGLSDQVLSKWKSSPTFPNPAHLIQVANRTGINYFALLEAVMRGKGYLPDDYGIRAEPVSEPMEQPATDRLRFRRYRAADVAVYRQLEERMRRLDPDSRAELEEYERNSRQAAVRDQQERSRRAFEAPETPDETG